MRRFSFYKIVALLFVFASGFSCGDCGGTYVQDKKAGELSIIDYLLYKKGVFMLPSDTINSTKDTLTIFLNQDFYNVINYNKSSSNLMACQEMNEIPNYIDKPDSISVTALSNFDNQTNANSNINNFCKLLKNNKSLELLSNFTFRNSYDALDICLIKNPTVDSIKLNIKLHFRNSGLMRSIDTKWLKFN